MTGNKKGGATIMFSTQIRMPDGLWNKVKEQAKKEIRSANSLVVKAVQLYLDSVVGKEPLQEVFPQASGSKDNSLKDEYSEKHVQTNADNDKKPDNRKTYYVPKEPIQGIEEKRRILEKYCKRPVNAPINTLEAEPDECPNPDCQAGKDKILSNHSPRTFTCHECGTVGYF